MFLAIGVLLYAHGRAQTCTHVTQKKKKKNSNFKCSLSWKTKIQLVLIYMTLIRTGCNKQIQLPGWLSSKESVCSAGDMVLIPGSGRSPRGGPGNPLQYFCLENPMDRGAWWSTVHRVTKSWIWLKWLST